MKISYLLINMNLILVYVMVVSSTVPTENSTFLLNEANKINQQDNEGSDGLLMNENKEPNQSNGTSTGLSMNENKEPNQSNGTSTGLPLNENKEPNQSSNRLKRSILNNYNNSHSIGDNNRNNSSNTGRSYINPLDEYSNINNLNNTGPSNGLSSPVKSKNTDDNLEPDHSDIIKNDDKKPSDRTKKSINVKFISRRKKSPLNVFN